MVFRVEVFVSPRKDVLDPQGKAVESALANLGFDGITDVRIGKYLTFSVESAEENSARSLVKDACEKLLTNPIIEDYTFDIRRA